jgi:hypothetical protein
LHAEKLKAQIIVFASFGKVSFGKSISENARTSPNDELRSALITLLLWRRGRDAGAGRMWRREPLMREAAIMPVETKTLFFASPADDKR